MKINNFIRTFILQIAVLGIFTQATFAETIALDLSNASNKQLIQEYIPAELEWTFLRRLSEIQCTNLEDAQNSIKQNGIEYTANSTEIYNALPYTNKLSFPKLTKAIFNTDNQVFDLTYQYRYLAGKNHEFIIRAKPSIDKAQEFETRLSNIAQQAPTEISDDLIIDINDWNILEDESINDMDLGTLDQTNVPIIIKNKSDHLVLIVQTQGKRISSYRTIASHETIVEYIDDSQNFHMYRIDPASAILNVAGSVGAAGAVATIGTTLATGACMLVSAPLSIPVMTGAAILGTAGFTIYKWVKAAKKRCPLACNTINPDEIDAELIAKITINNAEDESTIDSTLKLVNANKLLNKLLNKGTLKLAALHENLGQEHQSVEYFNNKLISLTSNSYTSLEFNNKVAELVLLVQEMENTINPPKQIGKIERLISFVQNPDNREAVITLVKAVK